MNDIPSPFSDASLNDAKKAAAGKSAFVWKMSREQIARAADEYVGLVGEDKVKERIAQVKAVMATYNEICGGTLRLTVPTLEAMIMAIGMVPGLADVNLIHNPKFQDLQLFLQAARRILQKEASEKAGKSMPPDLSTPPIDAPAV